MFKFDKDLGSVANMAKARGFKLKVNKTRSRDWKTGSSNAYLLVKGDEIPYQVVERGSSLTYIKAMLKRFPLLSSK